MRNKEKEKIDLIWEDKNWRINVYWTTWPADPTDHLKCEVFHKATYEREITWMDVGHGEKTLDWTGGTGRFLPKRIIQKANSLARQAYKQLMEINKQEEAERKVV